jgi:hypothetical protein
MEQVITEEQKKQKKKKKIILFAGLGTITAGIAGFFGWQWWKDKKDAKQQQHSGESGNYTPQPNSPYAPAQDTAKNNYHAPAPQGNDGFPLKKGSKGAKVKALQQALMAKYGASILPKYGADGSYGNEVIAALKKEGLPSSVDESTYNSIVGANASNAPSNTSNSSLSDSDAKDIAKAIYDAVENNNNDTDKGFAAAVKTLKRINNTDDYKKVNAVFEANYKFWGTLWEVSKSIVTELLDNYTASDQKVSLRLEFSRIGLKYDSNSEKWSLPLSGLPYQLITTSDTEVLDKNGAAIKVKANTLLGNPVGTRKGWLYFFPFNAKVLLKVNEEHVTVNKNNQ